MVFAVAHTYYVSALAKNKLSPFQYFRKTIDENAERILIEQLLALAVKLRFLDDKTGLVKKYDRKLRTMGDLSVENEKPEGIDIRTALNKLIHHKTISVIADDKSVVVVGSGIMTGDLQIPQGSYSESHVIIKTEGVQQSSQWKCEIDLFSLLNEILRVLYFQQANSALNPDAPNNGG